MLHASGAWVLEDCAHALFTDLVRGAVGRLGDASVLSLHKLLPAPGGVLITNSSERWTPGDLDAPEVLPRFLWDFDLCAIAAKRKNNTVALTELLGPLAGAADPLWPCLGDDDVLQTYPVLLRKANRNHVYEQMNARGYGVVSLYHTLVGGIGASNYPVSHALSRSILNLPVHQDLNASQLADLIAELTAVLGTAGTGD
jgi:dTDP-4-amino-4,6-dideoxygalactose transaminase